ncbi:B lymphocyte-induced maturation protein 1 [Araneus ventricosus]|uniref:B lymphocyte-induced maturation protein 1 n=1 Tax=Araneus ventricosus TaxID=182803 RepID=A0A4Y2RTY6_ARAVE|nr:B lymphocyte-induced maturation protein 1 [Araneus ventricosus]
MYILVEFNIVKCLINRDKAASSASGKISERLDGLDFANLFAFGIAKPPPYWLLLKCPNSTEESEKPFSCDVCNKGFSQKGDLNKHHLTHRNERPYSCDVCGTKYSQKVNLKRHYRIYTNEKPFSCEVCDGKITVHSVEGTHNTFILEKVAKEVSNPLNDIFSH